MYTRDNRKSHHFKGYKYKGPKLINKEYQFKEVLEQSKILFRSVSCLANLT